MKDLERKNIVMHWAFPSWRHKRTQYFTMEGVQVMGAGPEGLGDFCPPEGKAKFEISMHFLTFSCIKI